MAKVRIEAAEDELEAKAYEIAKSVLAGLSARDARIAKALTVLEDERRPSPVTMTPVMQAQLDRARAIYQEEMLALAEDIARELVER